MSAMSNIYEKPINCLSIKKNYMGVQVYNLDRYILCI